MWLITLFNVTSCSSQRAPIVDGWQQPAGKQSDYVVQKGDTLYSIAWAFNLDYRDLARINHLTPPYALNRGQKLDMSPSPAATKPIKSPIKLAWIQTKNNLPAPVHSSKKSLISQPKPAVKKTWVANSVKLPTQPIKHWLWPAKGKVIKGFSPVSGGNKGIEIGGHLGDPVIASADGKIVYSGSGLRGYGNLIIIKHNDNYLSAYAYNKTLLVKEGMSVQAGQKIAVMGSNTAGRVMLHFEIRRNGKPVNPIKLLG